MLGHEIYGAGNSRQLYTRNLHIRRYTVVKSTNSCKTDVV